MKNEDRYVSQRIIWISHFRESIEYIERCYEIHIVLSYIARLLLILFIYLFIERYLEKRISKLV